MDIGGDSRIDLTLATLLPAYDENASPEIMSSDPVLGISQMHMAVLISSRSIGLAYPKMLRI